MALMHRFARDERGATAVEYGLILAIIAAFIIGSMTAFQDAIAQTFARIASGMNLI